MSTLMPPVLDDRFWSKVNKRGPRFSNKGFCWLWTRATYGKGYGSFRFNGKSQSTHRLAYEALVGPIPEGLELDHLCKRRLCVRPTHLEPVTHYENLRRGDSWTYGRRENGNGWRLGALQSAKTHCPQGHPYSGNNLYLKPNGRRACRKCCREHNRNYRKSRKVA